MTNRGRGRLAGTTVHIHEAKDEVGALTILKEQKSIEFFDKRDKREARREAKAKSKITLPKFSWDK